MDEMSHVVVVVVVDVKLLCCCNGVVWLWAAEPIHVKDHAL